MNRKAFSVLAVLLVLCLFTGCDFISDALESNVTFNTKPSDEPDDQSAMGSESDDSQFAAYNLTISCSSLAVHSGPGYSYDTVTHITDQGTYLIVAEEVEKLAGGSATVWGKISGVGWINLEDAQASSAESPATTEPAATTEPPPSTEPADEEFEPYLFTIYNTWLEIFAGPGYHCYYVDSIKGGGVFTIVEESIQHFDSGRSVTWGKLKSGAGWICLDDALLDSEGGPPYRCTECGRADVSISRHALCDECYDKLNPAPYGYCTNCGDPLTYEESCNPWTVCDECPTDYGYTECSICGDILTDDEVELNDSMYCFDCLVCGFCGDRISIMDLAAYGVFMCQDCFEWEYFCHVCGADCYYRGTTDGMCDDCYEEAYRSNGYCTSCGVELTEWNTAYSGEGQCTDCYYKNLDPEYICDLCGADCSFRGVYDGLCEDCYEATH